MASSINKLKHLIYLNSNVVGDKFVGYKGRDGGEQTISPWVERDNRRYIRDILISGRVEGWEPKITQKFKTRIRKIITNDKKLSEDKDILKALDDASVVDSEYELDPSMAPLVRNFNRLVGEGKSPFPIGGGQTEEVFVSESEEEEQLLSNSDLDTEEEEETFGNPKSKTRSDSEPDDDALLAEIEELTTPKQPQKSSSSSTYSEPIAQPEFNVDAITSTIIATQASNQPPLPTGPEQQGLDEQPSLSDSSLINPSTNIEVKRYHPVSLTLYFGDKNAPVWDPDLQEHILDLNLSKAEIEWMSNAVIEDYGKKIFVKERKSSTKEELNELVQLQFCVMRNLQRGPRYATASVKLSDLQNLASGAKEAMTQPRLFVPNIIPGSKRGPFTEKEAGDAYIRRLERSKRQPVVKPGSGPNTSTTSYASYL